jgi:hypothetical protein
MIRTSAFFLMLSMASFTACTNNYCQSGICSAPTINLSGNDCNNPPVNSPGPFYFGSGSLTDPYVICNAAQLDSIGANPTLLQANYILAVDLDLASYDGSSVIKTFQTVGFFNFSSGTGSPFTGTFDGAQHTITNLKVDNFSTPISFTAGLFGYTKGATIKNLKLTSIDVRGLEQSGGLVGYGQATAISNISVQGSINSGADLSVHWVNRIGGIAGLLDSNGPGAANQINNCSANVMLYADDQAGGLVGSVVHQSGSFTLNNSQASGSIIGLSNPQQGNTFGGLVGYINMTSSSFTISNSSTRASVLTQGSFSGSGFGTIIESNNSTGTVTHVSSTGDFVSAGTSLNPNNWSHGSFDGGFMGILGVNSGSTIQILNSFNSGNVSNTGSLGGYDIGGFIGSLNAAGGTVQIGNCFSSGIVSIAAPGQVYEGGFIGNLSQDATSVVALTNTYESGSVNAAPGSSAVGGYLGGTANSLLPALVSNYWNNESNPTGIGNINTPPAGITGESIALLETQSTFVGWDFSAVWSGGNGAYPTLQ